MASLDVRKQLLCPLCNDLYADPVTLKCGHSFCRACVGSVLDAQQWSCAYSCPVCGEKSAERPELHKNLALHNIAEIYRSAEGCGRGPEEDLILDIDTASFQLHISEDRKSAARPTSQTRPDSPDRFWTFPQVLSTRTFSSGRHSWEVDIGGIDWCCVAMCYPSMDRNGRSSKMEDNTKAWCLVKLDNQYFMKHNWEEVRPPVKVSGNRIRVSLDYEAGQISFYELGDPIQLLHTFTSTFTEPLHAALGVYSEVGCMKIVGYNRDM